MCINDVIPCPAREHFASIFAKKLFSIKRHYIKLVGTKQNQRWKREDT